MREESVCQSRRLGLEHAAAETRPWSALSEIHRRKRKRAASGTASGRVDGPSRAVDRRNRESFHIAIRRQFRRRLSWMQDHRHPIFIVATANDISALPPELMRKGRFDEVFFVDLPSEAAREQVLGIHLERRKRDPSKFNLPALAKECPEFSGSEIEQAVVSALFAAFSERKELSDQHILSEMKKTRPLAVLSAERSRHYEPGRKIAAFPPTELRRAVSRPEQAQRSSGGPQRVDSPLPELRGACSSLAEQRSADSLDSSHKIRQSPLPSCRILGT